MQSLTKFLESKSIGKTLVHVRMNGQSHDLPLSTLGLGLDATESDIRRALSAWLDVSVDQTRNLMLDQSPNGNWILRPAAVFG